jgi:hypothetical protein
MSYVVQNRFRYYRSQPAYFLSNFCSLRILRKPNAKNNIDTRYSMSKTASIPLPGNISVATIWNMAVASIPVIPIVKGKLKFFIDISLGGELREQ